MTFKSILRSKGLVCGVLAAFVLFMTPAGALAKAPAAPGGSLTGFIYAKDMKTPVAGAVVKIRNIANQKEYTSGATDANGMYKVADVDEGRYILGVSGTQGDFNFDYVMHLKGGELAKLSVALAPGTLAKKDDSSKKSFFNSNAGFLIIIAAVGLIFYAIVFTGEKEASPIR